jgi:hypothetical protein
LACGRDRGCRARDPPEISAVLNPNPGQNAFITLHVFDCTPAVSSPSIKSVVYILAEGWDGMKIVHAYHCLK